MKYVYYKLFSPIVQLKGLKYVISMAILVCSLETCMVSLHGTCFCCTWMSAGDFVAWGITFLNLSFSHARTKACRNVYQLWKHRVYFIAQWAKLCTIKPSKWSIFYETLLSGHNMYSRCRNFVCGCHIVFAKNTFNMFLHTNLQTNFFFPC